MATKTGFFRSINGKLYEVEFSGDSVQAENITLDADPVSITMSPGSRKYTGFKTTACRVSIVTDTDLSDLYASTPRSVLLTVRETTVGLTEPVTVFVGYVLPFSFDQPVGDLNNVVEVHAVDLISAQKDVRYETLMGGPAVDALAVDIVKELCLRSEVLRFVVQDNFGRGAFNSSVLDQFDVAQAGLIQDELNIPEVISAVAMFAGFTANMVGDTLYLYDEYFTINEPTAASDNAMTYTYNLVEDEWRQSFGSTLAGNAVLREYPGGRMSIERAYDGIQIRPAGSDVAEVMPNLLADANLEDLNYDDQTGKTERVYKAYEGEGVRIPMTSRLAYTGRGNADGTLRPFTGTQDVDYMTSLWDNGSVPMLYDFIQEQQAGNAAGSALSFSRSNMLWLRARKASTTNDVNIFYTQPNVGRSHTGGYVRINVSGRATTLQRGEGDTYYVPEGDAISRNKTAAMMWLHVRCGSLFLNRPASSTEYYDKEYEWGTKRGKSPIFMSNGSDSMTKDAREFLVPGSVFQIPNSVAAAELSIEATIGKDTKEADGFYDYFITELSVTGVGDPINEEHPDMRHMFNPDGSEMLTADTFLTSRSSGRTERVTDGHLTFGVNARALVVPSIQWPEYMGDGTVPEDVPLSGVLMRQLAGRYGVPHKSYRVATDDSDIFTPALVFYNGDLYTVEGYERNLRDNIITLTLD